MNDVLDKIGDQSEYIVSNIYLSTKKLINGRCYYEDETWIFGEHILDQRYSYQTDLGLLKYTLFNGWVFKDFKGYKNIPACTNKKLTSFLYSVQREKFLTNDPKKTIFWCKFGITHK